VLLADLDEIGQPLSVPHLAPAALVEAQLGVDQLPPVREQPGDSVVGAAAFLVGGQRQDEIARRTKALPLQADQARDPDCGLRLVVAGPAAVEVAVLLQQV
jgi:hypothetical protein